MLKRKKVKKANPVARASRRVNTAKTFLDRKKEAKKTGIYKP